MLTRNFIRFFFLVFFFPGAVNGAEKGAYRIFSEYGIGLRGAAFVLERDYGGELTALAAYGLQLNAEGFGTRHHQVTIQLGYFKPIGGLENGSEQVRVRTEHHLTEAALAYTGRVFFMLFDVRMGLSMAIVSTEISTYDLGTPVSETNESDPFASGYAFPDKTLVDSEQNTGISNGFLVGTGIGVDMGSLLLDRPQLFDFRIGADYMRRGARNEFLFTYTITFWPTGLKK